MTGEDCQMARVALGWTESQLAAEARLVEPTIRTFEAGTTRPRPTTLVAIKNAFARAKLRHGE